jgi:hypothetical protein
MNEAEKYEVAWRLIGDVKRRCERFDLAKIRWPPLKEVSSSAAAVRVSRRAHAQAQRELS